MYCSDACWERDTEAIREAPAAASFGVCIRITCCQDVIVRIHECLYIISDRVCICFKSDLCRFVSGCSFERELERIINREGIRQGRVRVAIQCEAGIVRFFRNLVDAQYFHGFDRTRTRVW